MFHAPDLSTLRLCSVLASLAFGLVFLFLWRGRRDASYLLLWAGSSLSYIAIVTAFELAARPLHPLLGSLLYAALPASTLLLVIGIYRFEGRAPLAGWMLVPPLLSGGGYALGRATALHSGGDAAALASHFGACGLTACMLIFGLVLLRGTRGDNRFGRRIVGGALLAYCPGYGCAIIGKLTGLAAFELLATITMITDQMVLTLINLGLLTMPGERAMRILETQAHLDPLTGARTRAWLAARADRLCAAGTAVVLIDVDHFKQINDSHGHAIGDTVLVRIVQCFDAPVAAAGGSIVRLGGDEFVVLLPGLSPAQATTLADRLRCAVAQPAAGLPACTISMGLTLIQADDDRIDRAIARADALLYHAKAAGRDRVAA